MLLLQILTLTLLAGLAMPLGAAFSLGGSNGLLLCLLIGLQNLPEGFNAYRELRHAGHYSSQRIITTFALMALLGPLAGLLGYIWLRRGLIHHAVCRRRDSLLRVPGYCAPGQAGAALGAAHGGGVRLCPGDCRAYPHSLSP